MSEQNKNEIFPENGADNKESTLYVPHVYVPSFTEASENYRVAPEKAETEEPKVQVIEKTEDTVGAFDDDAEDYETLRNDHEAQVVRVQVTTEPDTAQSLFRAKKPTQEDEPEKVGTESDEAEDIHRLISPEEGRSEELADASDKETVIEEAGTDLSTYVLPDPEMPPEEEKEPTLEFVPMTVPDKKTSRALTFASPKDDVRSKNRFLDKILSVRVRLCAAALLTVLFAVGTVFSARGTDLSSVLGIGDYPFLIPLLDLQGCVCLLLLSIPETVLSFRTALSRKFVFSALYPLLFLLTAFFDITSAITGITGYPLFCGFFGLAATLMIYIRLLDLKSAFSAFCVLSEKGEKIAVEKVKTAELDKEVLALDGAIDEYRSVSARFRKTSFVSDFDQKIHETAGHGTDVLTAFFVAAGLTLVGSIVTLILGGDGLLSMFYTATLSAYILPLSAFCIFELPRRFVSRKNEKEKGAILGTASVLSYADTDVVAFADTEAFETEDIKIQHVRLFGENTYNDVFRDMTALFATVGGTLYQLFSEALDKSVDPATEPLAEKNGIAGKVDGVRVFAGTAAYLRKNGVAVPTEEEEKPALTNRVMYAAKNGVVTAEFLIAYSMSESFSMLLPHLQRAHVIPLIYTRDPNLDNELFTALLRQEDAVRVIKESLPEEKGDTLSSFSSGLVSAGGKSVAIFMILSAKKLGRFFRRVAKIAGYVAIAAPLLAVGLTLGGVKAGTVALILGLWQTLSFAAFALCSYRKFGSEKQ